MLFKLRLFGSLELRLFELIGLFGLFELCVFESFELFRLCAFKLCVGLGCASSFVCAWVSCFGFAYDGFAADLGAGVSGSARCAFGGGERPGVRGCSCCRRTLSVCSCCVRWVELVWVGSGWFGLICWVVEFRVGAMCGCLRSASASAWSCGTV